MAKAQKNPADFAAARHSHLLSLKLQQAKHPHIYKFAHLPGSY
jgi:hypothetical protein